MAKLDLHPTIPPLSGNPKCGVPPTVGSSFAPPLTRPSMRDHF